MNVNGYNFPKELTLKILFSLDFESKANSEAVCKLWNQSLHQIEEYQNKKEEYFVHKLFPAITTFPDGLVDIFGKKGIFCLPVYDVDRTLFSVEFEKEVTNFMLRKDSNFCRGEDREGRQYVAIAYNIWASSKEPKAHHNCAIICSEDEYAVKKYPDRPRKNFWEIDSYARIGCFSQIKELIEKGSLEHPLGSFASALTLGSNKKDREPAAALLYEAEIVYDYVALNIRSLLGRRTYTTYA